jgi:transmembrane sensor
METDHPQGGDTAVKDQARAWVMRLTSGKATIEDAEELRRWRDENIAHRQAFAEAKLLWETLGPSAEEVARRPAAVKPSRENSFPGRRAFVGGALAASAASVGYLAVKSPFHLWASIGELRADYRTGTGEQRQLALANDVSLILNTQTSVNIQPVSSGLRGIELVAGEAAISANAIVSAPFDVRAAGGRVRASAGRFDVRCDGASVRVACLDGVVEVSRRDQSVTVPPGHQVTYDGAGLRSVLPIDLAVATAWQHGMLIFRHEPLSHVIAEVNRYRPGRIMLLGERLGKCDVVASFHLNRIDEVVDHVVRAFDAHETSLPGGVVLLS